MVQAHPDVMNVLLQLLDDGRVTDSQVSCHMCPATLKPQIHTARSDLWTGRAHAVGTTPEAGTPKIEGPTSTTAQHLHSVEPAPTALTIYLLSTTGPDSQLPQRGGHHDQQLGQRRYLGGLKKCRSRRRCRRGIQPADARPRHGTGHRFESQFWGGSDDF